MSPPPNIPTLPPLPHPPPHRPSHRPLRPAMQPPISSYPPGIWPPALRSLESERTFPQVEHSLTLLARIGSLEDKVRYSPQLHQVLTEQNRLAGSVIQGVDNEGRLLLERRKRGGELLSLFGFPERDDDVDYCLEDTPGLSKGNFQLLKLSLHDHLAKIRRAATEATYQVEVMLGQQLAFRVVTLTEAERRLGYVVRRFLKGRRLVLQKYRMYVRNRRWIENVATRQRRGCLTHQQNNVLRMWLFSNFGNPYPDGANKRRLIAQTELSLTQINNWLINARSRVWKPTVELMSKDKLAEAFNSKADRDLDPTTDYTRNDWNNPQWNTNSLDFDHV